MKGHWLTALMAILLVGLGAYVYFVELPTEQKKIEAEAAEKQLLPFSQRDITELTVRSAGETIVLASAEDHKWKITSPIQVDADPREVDGLLRALTLGKVTRVVDEKPSDLGSYGLASPSVVLTLKGGGREETLSLGDSGPISSTLYAMRASEPTVLLTDLAAKDFLNKTVLTFRKKEVLSFEQSKADRLRLTYPKSEIVLYKLENKWKIRAPIEAPADQPVVRTLLLKLEDLKALSFIDPGPQRETVGKKLKEAAAKITVHAGDTEQTVKLYEPDPSSGEAYAVISADGPIYRISPLSIKDLTRDLFALQDKRLLGLEQDEIAMLSVKTHEEEYHLVKQTDQWVLEDRPAEKLDQQKVDLFVSRVVDLPAELRIVKESRPLAPYGLSSPTVEFAATAKDGKKRGRLTLGTKVGGLAYAMGQGLPGIYQVRSDLLAQVPSKQALLAKPATPPNHPTP